ncbi:MAG: hypothetical protein IPP47_00600 [Bryobacterales bacterium]|nr:hypothetical protein [Bryobacterales bacterium]
MVAGLVVKLHAVAASLLGQGRVGKSDGAFAGRDDGNAALKGRANVGDKRLAGFRIQRCQPDDYLAARARKASTSGAVPNAGSTGKPCGS